MDLKSVVLWTVALVGGLGTLIDSLMKIRSGVPLIKEHRLPILGAALFLAGASAGMLWEVRAVNQKQVYLNDVQHSFYDLQQKYEALVESFVCKNSTPSQVFLYEDINFGGRKLCFTPGSYADLRDFAFNDVTSSIRLKGDVKVLVYRDINFNPPFFIVDKDYKSLPAEWNDTISALKVCRRNDPCN